MAKTNGAETRARRLLAVPVDERADEWIEHAWATAGTLRSSGRVRRALDLEDAAERAEQAADAGAVDVARDRWPGSKWLHRGERVQVQVVAGPEIRSGLPSVKVRDGRRLRWEPLAALLEGYERVCA